MEYKIQPFHLLTETQQQQFLVKIATWHQQHWDHGDVYENAEKRALSYQQRFSTPDLPVLFLAMEQKVLGTVAIEKLHRTMEKNQSQKNAWLSLLYVAPEHRNQGIGRSILQYAIQVLKRMQFENCYLSTREQGAFYLKSGWTQLQTRLEEKPDLEIYKYRCNG